MLDIILSVIFVGVVAMWGCDIIYSPYKKKKK